MDKEAYRDQIADADAVVHTVGVLFEGSKYEQTYKAANRDTAVNMMSLMQEFAKEQD